jgi:hypothetical protein
VEAHGVFKEKRQPQTFEREPELMPPVEHGALRMPQSGKVRLEKLPSRPEEEAKPHLSPGLLHMEERWTVPLHSTLACHRSQDSCAKKFT